MNPTSQNSTNLFVKWWPLMIVGIGVALGPLDTAVNIAFPAINTYFKLAIADIQWVILCYVLTYATLLLGFGRIGDIVGHKRVYIVGLLWSLVSLFFCGYTSTFGWFLFARGMQGLGTALVLSCAPALATLNFPENERGKALGGFYLFFSLALTLGPMVGGYLVTQWGWQSVYYFRIPIAGFALLLAIPFLKQPPLEKNQQHFDWQGGFSLPLFIGFSLFALTQGNQWGWHSFYFLACLGMGGLCLIFFIWHELRIQEPIIDLRFFGHADFSFSNLGFILIIAPSFFIFLLVPYYLVSFLQIPTGTGGLLLAMAPFGTTVCSLLGGSLLSYISSKTLRLLGIVFASLGLWGISLLPQDPAIIGIIGLLFIHGCGIGLFQVAHSDYVIGLIPRKQRGVAGSLTILVNTLGVVSGAALGTFLFDSFKFKHTLALNRQILTQVDLAQQSFILAFQDTFLFGAASGVLTFILLGSTCFFGKKALSSIR